MFFGDTVATSSPADARCASPAGYCPLTSANGGCGDEVIIIRVPFMVRVEGLACIFALRETAKIKVGAVSKLGVQRIQWRDVGAAVGAGPLDGPCGEII